MLVLLRLGGDVMGGVGGMLVGGGDAGIPLLFMVATVTIPIEVTAIRLTGKL